MGRLVVGWMDLGEWTPADLPGVDLWLRADDLAALADGDTVTNWTSRIGGYVFTQSTTARKPKLYKTTTSHLIGGQPVVTFDGTDDLLVYGSSMSAMNHGSGFVIVVYKTLREPTGHESLFATANTGNNDRFLTLGLGVVGVGTPPFTRLSFNQREVSSADGDAAEGDDQILTDTPYVNEYLSTGTDYEMRVNGDPQTLTFAVGSDNGDWWSDSNTMNNVTIGARKRSTEANHVNADIAEIIGAGNATISSADRANLNAYLSSRYGITMV